MEKVLFALRISLFKKRNYKEAKDVLLYVALLIVCLLGVRLRKANDGEVAYLDKTQTKAIQGVFVVIVLFRHFSSYVTMENRLDEWFVFLDSRIG